MLLVFFTPKQSIIEQILLFPEDHAVLVEVITSVLASSLWLRKFLRQKRAEAFFGFYSKLSLRLKSLRTRLEENGQLNILPNGEGNIYSLIYLENYINTVCPKYKIPDDVELEPYQIAAKELKEILLDTNSNVYPPGAKRENDSQENRNKSSVGLCRAQLGLSSFVLGRETVCTRSVNAVSRSGKTSTLSSTYPAVFPNSGEDKGMQNSPGHTLKYTLGLFV